MMSLQKHQSKLLEILQENGIQPWLYRDQAQTVSCADWGLASVLMMSSSHDIPEWRKHVTNNAARNQYRRTLSRLKGMGLTPKEYLGIESSVGGITKESDGYIVTEFPDGGSYRMPVDEHEGMISAYHAHDGSHTSIRAICSKYKFPYSLFREYMKIHGLSSRTSPVEVNPEQIADSRIAIKQYQKLHKQVEEDADKWRNFSSTFYGDFVNSLVEYVPTEIKPRQRSNGNIAVISAFTDLHFGKRGRDYDLETAELRLRKSVASLLSDISGISKIIIPVGGDDLNFDNVYGNTSKGTPQDNDGDIVSIVLLWAKVFLDVLSEIANLGIKVDIVVVPGNHNKLMAHVFGELARAYFRNESNVSVVNDGESRVYVKHGNTLIGFDHGELKESKLPSVMASGASSHWGNTKYRYWLLGHYHTQKIVESEGCTIIRLPALSGIDNWHHDNGYTTNNAGAALYVFSETNGFLGMRQYYAD